MEHKMDRYLNWLTKEQVKDQKDLNREKQLLIQQIKKIDKKNLFPEKPKLTLWQKLKRVLMGQ